MKHKRWTQEEKDELAELYGSKSLDEIAKKLGRSVKAIINMRYRLHLGAFLDNGDYITLNQLLMAVKGIKHGAGYSLISWVKKRGLPVTSKKVGKCKFRVVRLDKFWKWAADNRSFIDFSKMPELTLGEEPAWVKEKRINDTLCKAFKKSTPWTALEDAQLRAYVKEGKKTGHEIAQLLHRTHGAVVRRCKDIGIENPKRASNEHNWSHEEFNDLVQNILDATPYPLIAVRMNLSEKAIRGMMYRRFKTENQDKIRAIIREGQA